VLERAKPAPGISFPKGIRGDIILAVALAITSFLLYLPTFSFGFVDYDDPEYITANPTVQQGLSLANVKWAFTTTTFSNWLPVTWLSHMLDCQLYGLEGGGHHATSALLHALNAALVFLLLHMLTGNRWRSAAVAALFTFHPLRVESVVWIAERKDVLSATFFLLTLIAYGWYCRRPSWRRYLLIVVAYALGLMSKTMLVTLPFVLLLLDYWPLARFRPGGKVDLASADSPEHATRVRRVGWLLAEKIPLFALAVISSVWTVILQHEGGAMIGGSKLALGLRLSNALVSVPRYLAKTLRPIDLSVFYPYPTHLPAWEVAGAAVLMAGITIFALLNARKRPYFAVGWFWFLGMLVPVCGIVQAGLQAMADRYMYLPHIGLFIAVVWGTGDLLERIPRLRSLAAPALGGVIALLAVCTWLQESYWQSTLDLFTHALVVDPNNWVAHDFVGLLHASGGDDAAAIADFRLAIANNPEHPNAHDNLADSLMRLGRVDEAIAEYREALVFQPDLQAAQAGLARALARKAAAPATQPRPQASHP
jgi:hypothetical protein